MCTYLQDKRCYGNVDYNLPVFSGKCPLFELSFTVKLSARNLDLIVEKLQGSATVISKYKS